MYKVAEASHFRGCRLACSLLVKLWGVGWRTVGAETGETGRVDMLGCIPQAKRTINCLEAGESYDLI